MIDHVLETLIPDIERLAETRIAKYRIPGLAMGIIRDQELAWFGGFGFANLDSDRKPNPNTIARVASVTKTFTTTAIMQLRDEGVLWLEDPLVRHIPEFSKVRANYDTVEGVTIRRLLTHRSGLVTESPTHGWAQLNFPTREEILDSLPDTEIVIPQDAAFKYSNLAFALLGEVVYRVTGTPYTEYVHANIIAPLGLQSTVFDLTDELRPHFFVGYNPTPYQDRPERAPYAHLKGLSSAGQLHSTIEDLAKWVSFQFRVDGGDRCDAQVLSGRTLAEIQRPQYVEPDWSGGQCLGWRVTRIGNHVYHNHGGGIHGFGTQVWFNAPTKTGAVVLINMWPPHGGLELVQEVLEMVLAADEAVAPVPSPPKFEPTPTSLQRLLGHYSAAPGLHANIEYRDGKLRLAPHSEATPSLHTPAELSPTEVDSEWLVHGGRASGEKAVFKFAPDGRVLSYELGAFVFKKHFLAD
ncbi:beta-lactamase family protein [Candidatus Poribacteria bacterium]|nr:beta-lactamase family protein [Candidatus Poribacteria bacterium]